MRRVLAIVLAAYALHFAWEMSHGTLFASINRLPFWVATAWCARAAGWDVAISAAAYFAASLAGRSVIWVEQRPGWPFALYFSVGLSITIVIERWALSVGRWEYQETMPTIAGIGLTPLLQWLVVPAAIFFLVRRVSRAKPIRYP